MFDLFTDASFKIEWSYVEQLRNSNLIVTYFIPTLLGLLRLDEGLTKMFNVIRGLDDFDIEFLTFISHLFSYVPNSRTSVHLKHRPSWRTRT